MVTQMDLGGMLFGTDDFWINILDVGAIDNPGDPAPYHALAKRGRARIVGFEPDKEGCARLNNIYGRPHRFFPHFIGDGNASNALRNQLGIDWLALQAQSPPPRKISESP